MAKAIADGNPNHDQFWLNEVLRPRDFMNLKLDLHARQRWLPKVTAEVRQADPSTADRLELLAHCPTAAQRAACRHFEHATDCG